MNNMIRTNDFIATNHGRISVLFNEIDPIGNNPSTDDGSRTYNPPKLPELEEVTPDLYYPENAEGPDPTEEEQRDRHEKDEIDTEEDVNKEKHDHTEDEIDNPNTDKK